MRVELFLLTQSAIGFLHIGVLTGTHGLPHAWPVMEATKDGVTPSASPGRQVSSAVGHMCNPVIQVRGRLA